MPPDRIAIGDSIAVNGVCLTATHVEGKVVRFDVSKETLNTCIISGWAPGVSVNLERALTLSTPLGGHLVSGHVDGVVEVCCRTDYDEYVELCFRVDRALGKLIAVKGSVAIEGVSLTVNTVVDRDQASEFTVMLVPHTLEQTTLGTFSEGMFAHLEVDPVARYLDRLMESRQQGLS